MTINTPNTYTENMTKNALLVELIDLLKKNNSDLKIIESFSNPVWQKKVTYENLLFLVQSEKKMLVESEELKNKLINEQKRYCEKILDNNNLSKLINGFINKERSDEVIDSFKEIYLQEDFGKSGFHKWNVLDHTIEALKIYRNLDIIPDSVTDGLNEQIDGITRSELLELAIIFHDAGKKIMFDKTGSMKNHEKYTINNQIDDISDRFNLSAKQKEFVSQLIGLHSTHDLYNNKELQKELKKKGIFNEVIIVMLVDLLATQGVKYDPEMGKKRLLWTRDNLN